MLLPRITILIKHIMLQGFSAHASYLLLIAPIFRFSERGAALSWAEDVHQVQDDHARDEIQCISDEEHALSDFFNASTVNSIAVLSRKNIVDQFENDDRREVEYYNNHNGNVDYMSLPLLESHLNRMCRLVEKLAKYDENYTDEHF